MMKKNNEEAESLIKQTEGFIELENFKKEQPVCILYLTCVPNFH